MQIKTEDICGRLGVDSFMHMGHAANEHRTFDPAPRPFVVPRIGGAE